MANVPTIGVFLPSYLNACNSPGPTGQQDAYGQNFPSGLNPGKVIELGTNEAQGLAAPGTTLYDGAYQWVQLDSGATAAYATEGMSAFFLLDSGGAAEGAQPETAYSVPVVTTADVAYSLYGSSVPVANAFFAGVFLNPATLNGSANGPTPGNWTVLFVGAGRATVQVGGVAAVALGGPVFPDTAHEGKFSGAASNALPTTPGAVGTGLSAAAENTAGVAYYKDIIYRIPN
jgi:hypothetical protein